MKPNKQAGAHSAMTVDATLTDRDVQRSRWLGFPDTIVIRFLDRSYGRSTVAFSSRSKFGEGVYIEAVIVAGALISSRHQ